MNPEDIFTYAHARILQTPAYRGMPGFPEKVEQSRTLSDLLFWLGNTPFPPGHQAESTARSELLVILSSITLTGLPLLLEHLLHTSTNVAVPSQRSIQEVEEAVARGDSMGARELAGQCLAWEVQRWRPTLRADIAAWMVHWL